MSGASLSDILVLILSEENREVVVDRKGVAYMLKLAERQVEPDFVIPALYNVCVEDEEVHEDPEILPKLEQAAAPTYAEAARAQLGVLPTGQSSIGILLDLYSSLRNEDRRPILAELVDMASDQSGCFQVRYSQLPWVTNTSVPGYQYYRQNFKSSYWNGCRHAPKASQIPWTRPCWVQF